MSTFSGFPQDGLLFLKELAENNERPWFEANKHRYETSLLKPAAEFITAVGDALQEVSPHIQYDTRTNGSGSLMRIYRDTRFSKDKTPYKTNISGLWWEGPGKKMACPTFGFQMNAAGMGLMAGMFGFHKEHLAKYRHAVNESQKGTELNQIISDLTSTGQYEIVGDRYKKVPRGFHSDHPQAELLKYKGLYAHPLANITPQQLMHPQIVAVCTEQLKKMAPLQQWLVRNLLDNFKT